MTLLTILRKINSLMTSKVTYRILWGEVLKIFEDATDCFVQLSECFWPPKYEGTHSSTVLRVKKGFLFLVYKQKSATSCFPITYFSRTFTAVHLETCTIVYTCSKPADCDSSIQPKLFVLLHGKWQSLQFLTWFLKDILVLWLYGL